MPLDSSLTAEKFQKAIDFDRAGEARNDGRTYTARISFLTQFFTDLETDHALANDPALIALIAEDAVTQPTCLETTEKECLAVATILKICPSLATEELVTPLLPLLDHAVLREKALYVVDAALTANLDEVVSNSMIEGLNRVIGFYLKADFSRDLTETEMTRALSIKSSLDGNDFCYVNLALSCKQRIQIRILELQTALTPERPDDQQPDLPNPDRQP